MSARLGGWPRVLTWFYGGLDLASGGVGRLRHVDFPEGGWVKNLWGLPRSEIVLT